MRTFISILLFVTASAYASERRTCAGIYESSFANKSSDLAFSDHPFFGSSIAILMVDGSMSDGGEFIYNGRIERSIHLIDGAYQSNKIFKSVAKRINHVLVHDHKMNPMTEQQIAQIIQRKNENGQLCPIKSTMKNGLPIYTAYDVHEIVSGIIQEITM